MPEPETFNRDKAPVRNPIAEAMRRLRDALDQLEAECEEKPVLYGALAPDLIYQIQQLIYQIQHIRTILARVGESKENPVNGVVPPSEQDYSPFI